MNGLLTPFDLANTVRMTHSQRQVTFLIVEGPTDATFFRSFKAERCELLVAFNRERALETLGILDKSLQAGVLAFVDADFDRLLHLPTPSSNCIVSDAHDLLVDLFRSSALDKLLGERGSDAKIGTLESGGRTVREVVSEQAEKVALLRLVNHVGSLQLKFRDIDLSRFTNLDTLEVDPADCCRVVVQRSGTLHDHDSVLAQSKAVFPMVTDRWQLVVGHDLVELLGIGLRRLLGVQRAQDVRSDVLEMELRLAFDWAALQATSWHTAFRQWEANNAGWPVLKA